MILFETSGFLFEASRRLCVHFESQSRVLGCLFFVDTSRRLFVCGWLHVIIFETVACDLFVDGCI